MYVTELIAVGIAVLIMYALFLALWVIDNERK